MLLAQVFESHPAAEQHAAFNNCEAMDPEFQKELEQATKSLERNQRFDPATMPRVEILGTGVNFREAIEPANRLLDLYKQLPLEVLGQLSRSFVSKIRRQADNDFQLLKAILDFEPGMPRQERDARLQRLIDAYDPAFLELHESISYSVRKSTDFGRLEREARALIQSATDKAEDLGKELVKRKTEADEVLAAVRKVAEEQGVSQQSIYFKNEADQHDRAAGRWLKATLSLTLILTLCAVGSLFIHKIPFLAPSTAYETAQLAISKVLIFATISFLLIFSGRTCAAHRHNTALNRHRQNSLSTYEALVRAAGDSANRDVVLAKAADSIFSAQPTGFGKSDVAKSGPMSLVSVSPSTFRAPAGT